MSDVNRHRDTNMKLGTRLPNTTLFELAPSMDTEAAP
jgi:hypothetical protein